MENKTEEILKARRHTHGDFNVNANFCQMLKMMIRNQLEQDPTRVITYVQLEALDNICQKVARIVTGNPNHVDSWDDIAGYARLASKSITDAGEAV